MRKDLLTENVSMEKMGDINFKSILLPGQGQGSLRCQEKQVCQSAVGQILVGGPWNVGICGKGASIADLPGQWAFGF